MTGTIKIADGKVAAVTDDERFTYVFRIKDNDTICFIEEESSSIFFVNGAGESVAFTDGMEFVFDDSESYPVEPSSTATEGAAIEGFQPTEDSTWGDVYRHFDPEGFEALTEEQQEELDHVLLNEESPQWVIKEEGTWFFE